MNMKAAASLTGSLLARKGAAYPASYSAPAASPDSGDDTVNGATPRAYNDPRVIASAPPTPISAPEQPAEQMQDGRFTPSPAASDVLATKTPINLAPEADTTPEANTTPEAETSPGVEPAPLLETKPVIESAPALEPAPAPAPTVETDITDGIGLPQTMDKMGRVRLSVRLDPDRYLRVKMASAQSRWSAQDIVIAALDRYLNGKSDSGSDDGNGDDGGNRGNLN